MTLRTPHHLAQDQGTSYWIGTAQLTVKIAGKDTGGAYTLLEIKAPNGMKLAPHTHTREDEVFVVTSGRVRVYCDNQPFELESGGCVFLPRNLQHSFEVLSEDFRALQIVNPSGFEDMLEELGDITKRPAQPGAIDPAAMARVMQVTQKYGQVMTPPPGMRPPAGVAPHVQHVPDEHQALHSH